MFGVQWDLVLKHLSNKGVSDSLLITDSSEWGNYINHTFVINVVLFVMKVAVINSLKQ